ncbi:hypothetical protein M0804_008996 [Polistes exclamans]|nr:hypothetical protein M0804_008996 [Polistes exclamans]
MCTRGPGRNQEDEEEEEEEREKKMVLLYSRCSRTRKADKQAANETRSKESISELYWGICVPAVCTPQDLEDVVTRVLAVAFTESRLKLTPRIPKGFCSDKIVSSVKTVNVLYYTCAVMLEKFAD